MKFTLECKEVVKNFLRTKEGRDKIQGELKKFFDKECEMSDEKNKL